MRVSIAPKGICISGSYTLSQTASENDVNRLVAAISNEETSRSVVMFLQDHNIKYSLRLIQFSHWFYDFVVRTLSKYRWGLYQLGTL